MIRTRLFAIVERQGFHDARSGFSEQFVHHFAGIVTVGTTKDGLTSAFVVKTHHTTETMSLGQVSSFGILWSILSEVDMLTCIGDPNIKVVFCSPLIRRSKTKISGPHLILFILIIKLCGK